MPTTQTETTTTNNNKHPMFEHADTLYAFLGEYVEGNLNNYAWTSWKNIKDEFRFILPHKIKLFAFYNSYKEDITIVCSRKKYVLESKDVTVIDSINFDVQYDVMKSSYKIGTFKFCITSSQGALSVTTADKAGKFQDNWTKIISDKNLYTEGIDVFCYRDETGAIYCTKASKVKTFKGRGNATWHMDKKSFKIKFDNSQSCLGMETTNSLVLLANYQDGTLMRNKFMCDIAHEAKLAFPPDSRYLDLYVNGSYKGVYQLSETHKLGKNKLVKITDIEEATTKKAQKVEKTSDFNVYATYATERYHKKEVGYNSGTIRYYDIPAKYNPDNNTGGYLIQLNTMGNSGDIASRFITPNGQLVDVLSPEYCTEAQIKYIYDYFVRIEKSIYDNTVDYKTLIDVESLAKTYVIQEMSKNMDGGVTSTFFYKDKEAIMYAGPVWDYDCALGNLYGSRKDEYGRVYDANQYFGWFTKKIAIPDNPNIRNLYTAACQIDEVWKEIQSVWKKDFMGAIDIVLGRKDPVGSRLKNIKDYAKMLFDAANVNYLIHPLPGTFDWIPCKELAFGEQIKYVIDWLGKRQKWLNDNILNTSTDYFVFLKQKQGWIPAAYFWIDGETEPSENKWPGGHMIDVGDSIYRITVPSNANRIIFSNNGGCQTVDIIIPKERNMVYDLDSGEWLKFV